MNRIVDLKVFFAFIFVMLYAPNSVYAQVKRADLIGVYDGMKLNKGTDEYKENISLSFTLDEDGSFSIINVHYIILADGTRMHFWYKSGGRWIFLSDKQKIVFAIAEGSDEMNLINVKKKNGKNYSEKALEKFKKSSTFKTYFRPIDFFSGGLSVKSVTDNKLEADLLNLPNVTCVWNKSSGYISISNPRLKQRIGDRNRIYK